MAAFGPSAPDTVGSRAFRADASLQTIGHLEPGETLTLPPDEEIIRRLRANDEGALEFLVAAYWQRLLRFVAGILDQEGGAEDVVQEVFIRLWMRRGELRMEGSFRAFLYTLARNAAIDERRRSGRREAVSAKADPPAVPVSPMAGAEAAEIQAVAETAIAAMPPRRREVFRLARAEGLSYREIAEVMAVSPQTVANQMSRALTELHAALDPVIREGPSDATGPDPPGP